MLFEKENELVEISIWRKTKKENLWLAIFEDGQKLKIAWLTKIKTTLERIDFLEKRGFKIFI